MRPSKYKTIREPIEYKPHLPTYYTTLIFPDVVENGKLSNTDISWSE